MGIRLFDTFDIPPGHYLGNDSEAKLLEAIAQAIQRDVRRTEQYPDSTRTVRLYSDFIICPSCEGVITAFQEVFPSIAFSYSDGE